VIFTKQFNVLNTVNRSVEIAIEHNEAAAMEFINTQMRA
jgi:hypothetical protein